MPVGTVYVPTGPKIAGKCNLTALKHPEKWLVVVKVTWKRFERTGVANKIMVLRYKRGVVDIYDIASHLNISRQRVYFVLSNIHNFALDYAKDYGAYTPKKIIGGSNIVINKKNGEEEGSESTD